MVIFTHLFDILKGDGYFPFWECGASIMRIVPIALLKPPHSQVRIERNEELDCLEVI